MTNAVTAEALALAYGGRVVLEHISCSVPVGSTAAVIGPNGSGKSTLLRAIAGLIRPFAGRLDVPAQSRRGGVAFVLQSTAVDTSLAITVRETVTMARYAHRGLIGRLGRADRRLVAESLERMDIGSLASRQLHELSGGQRQRVLVAQGLAQDGEVLLLDEPFTGLDIVSRELIGAAIDAERAGGRTVVVTTHELGDARRADLVVLLAGRLVAVGAPGDVLTGEILSAAYGSRVVQLANGDVFVDDPHHDHASARDDSH